MHSFLSLSPLCPQIELIDRVDDIYRNTSWDNAGFKGYGIQIEQIRILKSPEEVKPGERHYNMAKSYPNEEKDAWDVKMLLEVGCGVLGVMPFPPLCDFERAGRGRVDEGPR